MGLSVSSVGGQLLFIEATKTVPWPSRRVWLAVTAIAYLDGQNPAVGATTQAICSRIFCDINWCRILSINGMMFS